MRQRPPLLFPVVRVAREVVPDSAKRYLYPTADLLAAPGARLTPVVRAQLRAEFGAVLDAPTHSLYEARALIDRLAVLCYSDLSLAAARREQGRAGLLAWRRTPLGWLVTAALPLLGPTQILRRLPRLVGSITNFGTRWLIREGPTHWWFCSSDDPGVPEFFTGILDTLPDFTQMPGLAITLTVLSSHERVYEIRWEG